MESFFDTDLNTFAIAPIPLNLKQELAALIKVRTLGKTVDRQYLDSILPVGVGRDMFELTLRSFLHLAAPVIGEKEKNNQLYPWKIALCFVPDESVNAGVRLSAEKRANTVFIMMNIGVLLEPFHRLCATFTVPNFFESISHALNKTEVADPTDYYETHAKNGNWLSAIPNNNAASMAISICIKAAMAVLLHEFAHFLCGHLGYLQNKFDFTGTLREVQLEGDEDRLEPD